MDYFLYTPFEVKKNDCIEWSSCSGGLLRDATSVRVKLDPFLHQGHVIKRGMGVGCVVEVYESSTRGRGRVFRGKICDINAADHSFGMNITPVTAECRGRCKPHQNGERAMPTYILNPMIEIKAEPFSGEVEQAERFGFGLSDLEAEPLDRTATVDGAFGIQIAEDGDFIVELPTGQVSVWDQQLFESMLIRRHSQQTVETPDQISDRFRYELMRTDDDEPAGPA